MSTTSTSANQKSDIRNQKFPLYDVHTHVGLDQGFLLRGWWPYGATAQDLIGQMDAHGIGRAVSFPFCVSSAYDPYAFADRQRVELLPGRVPYDRENALLAAELERIDPAGRLIMFAMFDPAREVARQVANLEKLRRAPGSRLMGLKLQATVIEAPVRALLEEGRPLMEFAEAHALPVVIHTSIVPSDRWSPAEDCLAVAEAFPRARFNLAHTLRFHEPSLRRAAEIPNVWVDCAAHLNHCELAVADSPAVAVKGERMDADYSNPVDALRAAHALLGAKYLWGSDNPFQSWCDDGMRLIHTYKQEADVLHALPQDVKLDIAQRGPEAWLKAGPRE